MRLARRPLVGGALMAALARPGHAQTGGTLNFVPVADVTVLDPYYSGTDVSVEHGYMVFDTLYAMDAGLQPRPQMLEGHEVSPDGLRWRLTLREGLRFHDGAPVLAEDAVASIRRWAGIDVFGMSLMAATDRLDVVSDRVFEFRLKRPFPLLPNALGKPATYTPFIMPRRLLEGVGKGQIKEIIGSGPYRYSAGERVVGAQVVYRRFEGDVPRPEPSSWLAGGKRAAFERVVWRIIPDAATAAASLQKGEVDWWADVPPDLAPALRRDPALRVQINDAIGGEVIMRFNGLNPPFDNPAVWRAILPAIRQADFMTAIAGDDHDVWRDRVGVWSVGKPMSTEAGVEVMAGDVAKARQLLAASGYKGERVVVMAAADYASLFAVAQVGADLLRRIGFNVDLQTMDYGTQVQRRGNRAAVEQGGWSMFFTWFNGFNRYDPAAHLGITDNWFGWIKLPEIAALRERWFDAPDLATRQAIAREIQQRVWQEVPYIPLGTYYPITAYRRELTGVPKGGWTVFNLRRM